MSHAAVNGATEAFGKLCEAGCGRPVSESHGRRYCSDRCRLVGWAKRTASQAEIQFQEKPSKATRCQLVLGRLQEGRATGLDLLKAGGGTRYGARLADLRRRGHCILGPLPWTRPDGSREERTVPATPEGWEQYELVIES